MRRLLTHLLLAASLGLLAWDAPGPFAREAWFVLEILLVTIATRTVTWATASSALSLGIGIVSPLVVVIGLGLDTIGLDPSSESMSALVVPALEEALKLLPAVFLALMWQRRVRVPFNATDWLLVGCAAGAGFALVENAQLVAHNPGVLRDMARQYGPSLLVPGAWGEAGYVGHAAATGMITAGIGLGLTWRRRGAAAAWLAPALIVGPLAWIVIEHMLANAHANGAGTWSILLGNGRVTPWLFLALAAGAVWTDTLALRHAWAHSRTLRQQGRVLRALLLSRAPKTPSLDRLIVAAARYARILNTTASFCLTRRLR